MPIAEDPLVKLRELHLLFMLEPGTTSKTKLATSAMEEVGNLRSINLSDGERTEMGGMVKDLASHLGV